MELPDIGRFGCRRRFLALLRRGSGGRVDVASAVSHPKPGLHPNTVRVMQERYGIDLSGHRTTALSAVADRRFDYVITLCDKGS